MPTYKQIQRFTKERYGFKVKTCWIAHVKSDWGLTTRIAPNRQDRARRIKVCPAHQRPAIEAALQHFGVRPACLALGNFTSAPASLTGYPPNTLCEFVSNRLPTAGNR